MMNHNKILSVRPLVKVGIYYLNEYEQWYAKMGLLETLIIKESNLIFSVWSLE